MKLAPLLILGAAGAGLWWFLRRRSNFSNESLREDRPAPKVKKKDQGILQGRPAIAALFALPTIIAGLAPAPQYSFEDTAAIYRENAAGGNQSDNLPQGLDSVDFSKNQYSA